MLTVKAKRDYELILRAKNGDQRAFGQLMNLYSKNIQFEIQKLVKNPEEANDLMLESMAKAFEQLDSYQPNFAFSTWLKRVSLNHTIDSLRKRKIETLSIDEVMNTNGEFQNMEIACTGLSAHDRLERNEKESLVQGFVEELKGIYKDLIQLRYFEELSYAEISLKMEIPIGTVKARLHRAKGLLKDIMVDSPQLMVNY